MRKNPKSLTALAFVVDKHGDVINGFYDPKKNGAMASARMQLLPALEAAKELNIKTSVLSLHSNHPADFVKVKNSDICLVGKMSANTNDLVHSMAMANLSAVCRLKSRGAKIVAQFSDYVFGRPDPLSNFYKDIFHLADHIIFPCNALRELTLKQVTTAAHSHVINDPWQVSKPYQVNPLADGETLRIIWFGSNKNVEYLLDILEEILQNWKSERSCELTVLGQNFALSKVKKRLTRIKGPFPQWKLRLVPWRIDLQPHQLENEIARAHVSLIPSNPSDLKKSGVSHNRLVDSVRGGCITVASPMESYKELPGVALLGDKISLMLNDAEKNYNELCHELFLKRDEQLNKFSPEKNKGNWLKFWRI